MLIRLNALPLTEERKIIYLVKMSCSVLFFNHGSINLLPADIFKKIINLITSAEMNIHNHFWHYQIVPSKFTIELIKYQHIGTLKNNILIKQFRVVPLRLSVIIKITLRFRTLECQLD